GLTIFLDHPEVPLDNNEVERILRGPIIGRKNFLYFGKGWSAHLGAMLWRILATADCNELHPLTYLTAYLQACADNGGRPLSGPELDRFLPWALAPEDRAVWSRPLPPEPPANLIPTTPPPRRAKLRIHPRLRVPAPVQEVDTS
ncbi:MAG TPA: transposase, partial [Chloroflexota bacterium]|nr:transposase [Chloroflexota bacterium]